MAKPAILAVDDDAGVVAAVVRDLRTQYGEDYRILRATSGAEALEILADQLLKDRPIAAVVSDQRMPGMTGIEVLQEVRQQSPDSKLVLLTAYADTDVAIQAINDIALDYYLMKPWDPPEERLYPVLDELLRDWAHGHPDRDSEVRVVGHRWSERTPRGQDVPHPQPRALPLARGRPGRGGDPAARPRRCRRRRPPRRRAAGRCRAPLAHHHRARRRPRAAHPRRAAALRPVHRRRRTGRPRRRGVRRLRGAARPSSSSATPRADRPGRARRSRTTSASPRASPAPTSPTGPWPRRRGSAPRWCSRATSSASRPAARCGQCCSTAPATSRRVPCSWPAGCPTDAWTRPASTASSAAGSTTAPARARRRRRSVRTCTSWARRTQPARPPSTSPAMPSRWCSSCAAPRWRRRCRSTSSAASSRRPTSRSGCRRRSCGTAATGTSRASRCATRAPAPSRRSPPARSSSSSARPRGRSGSAPRSSATTAASCSPAPTCLPTCRGRWTATPFALETSVPGVFAAGDVRRDSMKRVASAVGEGAMSVYLVHRYLAAT